MRFAVLALLGIASVDASKYHKHPYKHYKQRYQIAQVEADPKDEKKAPTPAENRKTFEAAVKAAGMTVDTQQSYESTKTADVASRNAANTKETFDKKAGVRTARQEQIQGEVAHRQWVTRSGQSNWAQISSRGAPDVTEEKQDAAEAALKKDADDNDKKAADAQKAQDEKNGADDTSVKAAADEDGKAAKGDKEAPAGDAASKDSSKDGDAAKAQALPPPQNPENAYKVKAKNLGVSLDVTATQRADEAAWNKANDAARAKQDKETLDKKNEVRIARREQSGGDIYGDAAAYKYLRNKGVIETLAQRQSFINARSESSSSDSDSD